MNTLDAAILYRQHLATMQSRADQALQRGGFDHLVVPSGSVHYQAFDDRDYPYAVNPWFKAWLPLTRNPGCWLVHTPGQRPKLLYLQPVDYWHAVPRAPAGPWVEHFEVVVIREPGEASKHLPKAAARCAILGEPQSALGDYGAWKPNNPRPVLDYLDYHRAYKTGYEISMMRAATARGARAHRAAERAFRAGASEFGIHLAYCQAAGQDADELPYGNIVALDRHAAVLHYTDRDRVPPAGGARSFLIDAGASHAGYACDITRTHVRDTGHEFQSLVEAVDAAERRLCDRVRPGVDYRDIHLEAHLAMARILRDFGILRIEPETAVETGVSGAFFPHGIGHLIGLQVHDVGGLAESDRGGAIPRPEGHPYLRLTRTLAPGMVVTIEPGIYFIDLLLDELRGKDAGAGVDWERVARFRPFGGVRIEDDVACTDAAPENLSRDAFAAAG
jgi:Xaa-Pro dipeptidase